MPLEDFFIAYGKQDRQPGEFVESGARAACRQGDAVRRLQDHQAPRRGHHRAARRVPPELGEDGTVATIRIAFGGMAATPKRARGGRGGAARQALDGSDGRGGDGGIMPTDFTPLTDMRASAEYRLLAAQNLLLRFFLETSGSRRRCRSRRHEAA